MKPVRVGVIGGSGLYGMDELKDVEEHHIPTPFGDPSDAIVIGTFGSTRVAFLARHGRGHRHIPSQVPYRANIYALKVLGVEQVISVSACGSLRKDLHPGEMVVPDQLYDNTKYRVNTFFGEGLAAHISVAQPFCPQLAGLLADAAGAVGARVHLGGTLITIEGPRFSTKGESHTFRSWGMDIINMTSCPEAFLAREAEMCYAVLNTISDYDVWHESEEPVTVEMVIEILNQNAKVAQSAIKVLVEVLAEERSCLCRNTLGQALITHRDLISQETLKRLGPLVQRYLGDGAGA